MSNLIIECVIKVDRYLVKRRNYRIKDPDISTKDKGLLKYIFN